MVEHHVANVRVVSSNLIARSNTFNGLAEFSRAEVYTGSRVTRLSRTRIRQEIASEPLYLGGTKSR